MSSTNLVCRMCGETTSSFFIVIGTEAICNKCKSNNKIKTTGEFQKPRIFTRYICVTHNCGTYNNSNMYLRHQMKDCDIKTQETLGIIRPATFGGINGDIGRNYFIGLNELVRLKTNLSNYKRFAMIHFKKNNKMNTRKMSYTNMKYYNGHVRFLRPTINPNFHKYDELFSKLKFNLNMYIQSIPQKFKSFSLTREERSKLYYKNLMKNFQVQVVSK